MYIIRFTVMSTGFVPVYVIDSFTNKSCVEELIDT